MKKYGDFYVTIGLEIHVALKTHEKLFSHTKNSFSVNEFSLFDVGFPGELPVLSMEPVKMAVAFALAVDADLQKYSIFERKHYFYPDLPLGYQITQQHKPILIGGQVPVIIDGKRQYIQIEHAHLECDAAKSVHDARVGYTTIDISRCASPLLEIVSTPCMHSPAEAKEYTKEVHSLVMFLGICDGKMEEGSFRVDASISLSRVKNKLGTRVEIKNISSFSFLEDALKFEIDRQSELLLAGEYIHMETRLFDEVSGLTKPMRDKETVSEYRYMPDPDIPPLVLSDDLISCVENEYPIDFFVLKEKIQLCFEQAAIVCEDYHTLMLTQKQIWRSLIKGHYSVTDRLLRILAFWLPDVLAKTDTTRTISLMEILKLDKSNLQAKELKDTLLKWFTSDKDIEDCLPTFIDDSELEIITLQIINLYPTQIEKFKAGELKLLQFFVGKVMAELKGKAPATKIKDTVMTILSAF